MKPKLRPVKGWKFRVILCDCDGHIVFDDVAYIDLVLPMTESLIKDLKEKTKGGGV
jgi:hypothetical protein